MCLQEKTIMVLGGTTSSMLFVNTAKEMGVRTVVVDMNPNSPAKTIADSAYTISTSEIDSLVEIAQSEKVRGIVTGYDDFNTSIAVKLCERLKLRFYATKEQIELTKDKIRFKEMCRNYEVPVVEEFKEDRPEFPCVVKPADSYSAKGISICRNTHAFKESIELALAFSAQKKYLIEKYMDHKTVDCVNIDYVLRDGDIKVSCIGDKKVVCQGDKAPITSAVIYPSKHQEEYMQHINTNVINMFQSLGMKNGTAFIESFYDESGFHIYEMGYRVGGGQSSIILNYIQNVDYIKMLIDYSLSGVMCNNYIFGSITPEIGKYACGLLAIINTGTIGRIDGLEEIGNLTGVINRTQYLNVGNNVQRKYVGTLGQSFARFHIVTDTKQELNKTISKIADTLSVKDRNGHEMLIPMYRE